MLKIEWWTLMILKKKITYKETWLKPKFKELMIYLFPWNLSLKDIWKFQEVETPIRIQTKKHHVFVQIAKSFKHTMSLILKSKS